MPNIFNISYITITFDLVERDVKLFEVDAKTLLKYVQNPNSIPSEELSIVKQLLIPQQALPAIFSNRRDVPNNDNHRQLLLQSINWIAKLSALNAIAESINLLNNKELKLWRRLFIEMMNVDELFATISGNALFYMLRKLLHCYNTYSQNVNRERADNSFQTTCKEKCKALFFQACGQTNSSLELVNDFNQLKQIRTAYPTIFEGGDLQWQIAIIVKSKTFLKYGDQYRMQKRALMSIDSLWRLMKPAIRLADINWLEGELTQINHNIKPPATLMDSIVNYIAACWLVFKEHKYTCIGSFLMALFLYVASNLVTSTLIASQQEVLKSIQEIEIIRNNQSLSSEEKQLTEGLLKFLLSAVRSNNSAEATTRITSAVAAYNTVSSSMPYVFAGIGLAAFLTLGVLAAREVVSPLQVPNWLQQLKSELQGPEAEHAHFATLRHA